jgi:hypothetical protein
MKAPHLRLLAIPAVAAALAAGLTATAAGAATAHAAQGAQAARTSAAATATSPGSITSTVTGTFTNADGQGTFTGTFVPTKFSVVNGILEATGLLKGTLTDANGTKLGTVSQTATIPVKTSGASTSGAKANAANAVLACNVLNLLLGPLNLNLLGLQVTLNQVNPRHQRDTGRGQPARQPAVRGGQSAEWRRCPQRSPRPDLHAAQPDSRPALIPAGKRAAAAPRKRAAALLCAAVIRPHYAGS